MRFRATPGWGPLVVVVGGPSPLLAAGPGSGSLPLSAGVCRLRWWWLLVLLGLGGGFPVLCVFVAQAGVRGARAFVCFVCLWWLCWWRSGWCGVGVSSACAGVCVCVHVVCRWSLVACPCLSRLGLAAGVCVGVAAVCCGWSPATPS